MEDLHKEEDFDCVGYLNCIEVHDPLSLEVGDLDGGVGLILTEGAYGIPYLGEVMNALYVLH